MQAGMITFTNMDFKLNYQVLNNYARDDQGVISLLLTQKWNIFRFTPVSSSTSASFLLHFFHIKFIVELGKDLWGHFCAARDLYAHRS